MSLMTHRATVQHNTDSGTDAWNRPNPPTFANLGADPVVRCRAWIKTRKELRDDGKEVIVEDMRAVFPPATDISTGDRITKITNRTGTILFNGPFAVGAVSLRGGNLKHLEAMLTRHE